MPDPQTLALLATDRWRVDVQVARHVLSDGQRWGAIATRTRRGAARRAEPGPAGALILEARTEPDGVVLEVWGPAGTEAGVVASALEASAGWATLRDDLDGFAELAGAHPVTRGLLRQVGEVRLSRIPRVGEALGRAVLSQLVQGVEAFRSIAQVAGRVGTAAGGGLWAWPTARQIGSVTAAELRRSGVSMRAARGLHAAAVADARLTAAAKACDWRRLDVLLQGLPGCGAWTSAEARIALGDPDAVSVGDYHLPSLIGSALGTPGGRREDYDDAQMLALLAPFAPHRGRVIRLLEAAQTRGLVALPARRGPRAALSAHRYW